MTTPRGRYAPSPTGELHLGNAASALLAWLSIRSRAGTFVLRMEDLDRARVRPGCAERILEDLAWLGLDWDEGPDVGGPHPPYEQWPRLDRYRRAFESLRERGCLYPCFCSRRDVVAAASAPQTPGDEMRYPGSCRELAPEDAQQRTERGDRHAWRFRVDAAERPTFVDRVHGNWGHDETQPPGDFVVFRADGVPAYQLAVVVDDEEMRIDEVVRGDDLLSSTARQLLLYRALDHEPPEFGHVPLLIDTEGHRLSKRQKGITLRELREAGHAAQEITGRLASMLGLPSGADRLRPCDLVDGFDLAALEPAPSGIVVDVGDWRGE